MAWRILAARDFGLREDPLSPFLEPFSSPSGRSPASTTVPSRPPPPPPNKPPKPKAPKSLAATP